MFEIVFVGTSAAIPSPRRGRPATLVRYGAKKFLVDCGDGTARQMVPGRRIRGLNKALTEPLFVLITHGHADHFLGMGQLLYYLSMTTNAKLVRIYAPYAAGAQIRRLVGMVDIKGGLKVEVNEFVSRLVFQDDEITCTAFPTYHTPDSYGFRFDERQRRPFLTDIADRIGVPEGRLRRELVSGRPVVLEGGTTVQPDQVLGPSVPGQSLVITGDAVFGPELVEAARGTDCLIAEAPYLEHDRPLATKHGHLTALDAGRLALEAGTRALFLHHLSTRYTDEAVLIEARRVFKHARLANDFDYVRIGAEIVLQEDGRGRNPVSQSEGE